MQMRFPALRWVLLILLLLGLGSGGEAVRAQVRIPAEARADVAEVDQILRVGDQLERQNRWGEALAHYEKALREHPEREDLEQRLTVARLHYDVARRYSDSSFVEAVESLDEQAALDLYIEVLLKIDSHYVESPDWNEVVEQGITALQVALNESSFVKQHDLQSGQREPAEDFRQLRDRWSRQGLSSRHDARSAIRELARTAHRQLQIPRQAAILECTCAAAGSLDEYSAFLTRSQLEEVLSQIEGNFVGLGIELKAEDGSLLIVDVIPGGPADQAGLEPGERIVEVDGYSTEEVSTDVAADMLKGLEGSTVQLSIQEPEGDQQRRLQLTRRRVEVPSVEDISILDPDHGIAYLRLTSFQKRTSRDVEAALWELHGQGMRSLIVDVRDNPGGLLTAAVEVADKFVSDGGIVSTRGRSSGENYRYQAHRVGTWRVPLIVLIDGNSASASEIFAGAIADHRRGTVVGSRSYGKGSVQGIFPLNAAGAGIRLTTSKFYSPQDRPISRRGIKPDVIVHSTAKPAGASVVSDPGEDPVLKAGIQVARQQFSQR